jgi:hypothetical protein
MSHLVQVPQGNTVYLEVDLADADGNDVAPGTLVDYHVYVYDIKAHKKLLFTFKKTPVAVTDKQVEVIDPLKTIGCVLNPEDTATIKPCVLWAEVRTQSSASVIFANEKFNGGDDGFEICEITESANPSAMPTA